jgi:hypothetical protein
MLLDVEKQSLQAMLKKHGVLAVLDVLTEDEDIPSGELSACVDLLQERTDEATDREDQSEALEAEEDALSDDDDEALSEDEEDE